MKKSLILFLTLFSLSSYAQPVLTKSGNAPKHLDSSLGFIHQFSTMANPGNAGANQTFDVSGFGGDFSYTLLYLNADNSFPIFDSFPGATLVIEFPLTTGWEYSYYSVGDSALYLHGSVIDNDPATPNTYLTAERFEPPIQIMRYPMSYGKSYSQDTVNRVTLSASGTNSIMRYLVNVEAGAYGTLIDPYEKNFNVLRVSVTRSLLDNSNMPNGDFITKHLFCTPNVPVPIHEVQQYKQGNQQGSGSYYTSRPFGNPSSVLNPNDFHYSAYPNPANRGEFVQLALDNTIHPTNTVSLISIDGRVTKLAYSNTGFKLPENLSPGLYVYQIQSNQGVIQGKISVN